MTLYSSGCPKCNMLKSILDRKKVEYKIEDNKEVYIPIAEANHINSMPFAEVDGEVLDCDQLQQYVKNI